MRFLTLLFPIFLISCAHLEKVSEKKDPEDPPVVDTKGTKKTEHKFEELYITKFKNLPGTERGYCWPWSLAVIKTKNGERSGEVTLEEWKEIETESKVETDSGGTNGYDILEYFYSRGYSLEIAIMEEGKCVDYWYAAKKMNKGCDVMTWIMPKEIPNAQGVGAHIETVLGIEQCSAYTNSWGSKGRITTKKRFLHNNMREYNRLPSEGFFLIACKKEEKKPNVKARKLRSRVFDIQVRR